MPAPHLGSPQSTDLGTELRSTTTRSRRGGGRFPGSEGLMGGWGLAPESWALSIVLRP